MVCSDSGLSSACSQRDMYSIEPVQGKIADASKYDYADYKHAGNPQPESGRLGVSGRI